MAGIVAISSSVTMVAGDTAVDNSFSGWVTGETITLSTNPTGTNYSWVLNVPTSSTVARSALSASTGSSVTFTPDVAGTFTAEVTVDSSTLYILRLTVTSTAVSQLAEAIRQSPKTDTSVPTPARGMCLFFSDTHETFCGKTENGIVIPLLVGKVATALGNADATVTLAGGDLYVLPPVPLTANRALTLGTAGAAAGDIIRVVRLDTAAFTYAIITQGGATIDTFASATKGDREYKYDGAAWAIHARRLLNA